MSASGFSVMKKRTGVRKTKYIAYVASTIDGRISLTKKTRPDWTSPEDWRHFQAGLEKANAVVVGSNTYAAAKFRLDKRATFVLTSKVKSVKRVGSVTFVNPRYTSIKELLSTCPVVAIAGGGVVYRTMLEQGLVDELYVTIEPLVFGRGTEMFSDGTKTVRFVLKAIKKLNTRGTVLLHYTKL